MTIRSAIATIAGCTLLLAGIGASVGFGLGTIIPDYYRSVFILGREQGFDPVSVGVGQGLTQGAAGGAVVGLVLVALFCWRETQIQRGSDSSLPPARTGSLARRLLLATGIFLALGLCFVSGLITGSRSVYSSRYREELQAIAPILAGDPAFEWVDVYDSPTSRVYLTGEVSTHDDLDRLRSKVVRAVGEHRAELIMRTLRVRQ